MRILIGHLVGDYLVPFTGWTAKNKTENSLVGWIACLMHVIAYTVILALFVRDFSLWKIADEELIPEFMKDPEMGICDYADFLFFTKETHSCEAWELKVDSDSLQ